MSQAIGVAHGATAPVSPGEVRKVESTSSAQSRDQSPRGDGAARRQSDRELIEAIDRLAGQFSDSRLTIVKHEGADAFVYRMIDQESGEVIRQWPSENFLELRTYLRTHQAGLVDERA